MPNLQALRRLYLELDSSTRSEYRYSFVTLRNGIKSAEALINSHDWGVRPDTLQRAQGFLTEAKEHLLKYQNTPEDSSLRGVRFMDAVRSLLGSIELIYGELTGRSPSH